MSIDRRFGGKCIHGITDRLWSDFCIFRISDNFTDDDLILIGWEIMDTRQKGEIFFRTPFRYFFVREHHEFFDQEVGSHPFSFLYGDHRRSIIFELRLIGFENDFPFLFSSFFENGKEFGMVRIFFRELFLDGFIDSFLLTLDHSFGEK